MPTPSSGPISFSDIVAEFGNLNGSPASFSEYGPGLTTITGYGGTTKGIPPTTSPSGVTLPASNISFSLYRNRIARANPSKIINFLTLSFSAQTLYSQGSSGTHTRHYPLGSAFISLNEAGGNQTHTNIAPSLGFRPNDVSGGGDEDITACEGNTIVYWVLGRANGNAPATCFINRTDTFATASVDNVSVANSGTNLADKIHRYSIYDLRSGFEPKGEYASFYFSSKSSVTIVHETLGDPNNKNGSTTTGVPRNLSKVRGAIITVPGNWRGEGGDDIDSNVQSGFFVIPNRWVLRSHAMLVNAAPTMTLRPYEIAMVHYAGNRTNTYPPLPTVVGNVGTPITRMWAVSSVDRGTSTMVLYANNSNVTTTYSFGSSSSSADGFPGQAVTTNAGTGWVPAVYIFSMTGKHLDGTSTDNATWSPGGDGWLSSRII